LVPSPVTLDGSGATNITVTVTTTAATAGLTDPTGGTPAGRLFWIGMLWAVSAGFAAWVRTHNKKLLSLAWSFVLLACLGSLMAGCGGGGHTSGSPGTPVGTYILTVTGTSSPGSVTLSHSTQLTLVVQ
jgi:hypothetical protein